MGASVYPIGLVRLHEKTCVVIGGGAVAERKVGGLLDVGARVTVVSPSVTAELQRWIEAGRVTHVARAYRPGDLEGVFLCIAATDDRAVNEQAWRDGEARGVLANSVDDAAHSHFLAPAVLRRGDLCVAVSTGGQSPALAVRIRDELAKTLGPEYEPLLEILAVLRPRLRAGLGPKARKAFARAAIDSDMLPGLRAGNRAGARARAEELFDALRERDE